MATIDIPITHVFTRRDARKIDEAAVRGLIASIREIGIINPLRVRPTKAHVNGVEGDAYEVVAGAHRLRAARKVGLETVPCSVVEDDDLHAELAMIDENLCRAELSAADRAKQTARRKAIYEKLHPETGHGENQHTRSRQVGDSSGNVVRFTADTAEKTGKAERVVQRDAERGEKIDSETLERIRGTHLDTGTYLDALKKLDAAAQAKNIMAKRGRKALSPEQKEQRQEAKAAQKAEALRAAALAKLPTVDGKERRNELFRELDNLKKEAQAFRARNLRAEEAHGGGLRDYQGGDEGSCHPCRLQGRRLRGDRAAGRASSEGHRPPVPVGHVHGRGWAGRGRRSGLGFRRHRCWRGAGCGAQGRPRQGPQAQVRRAADRTAGHRLPRPGRSQEGIREEQGQGGAASGLRDGGTRCCEREGRAVLARPAEAKIPA
jgi:hypothetical protein